MRKREIGIWASISAVSISSATSGIVISRRGIDTASQAEEALDVVRARPPAMIVSDVRMPGRDGIALASAVLFLILLGLAVWREPPWVAAILGVNQVSDIMSVEGGRTFKRPIYAGSVVVTVDVPEGVPVVATVRTASYRAVGAGNSAPVEALEVSADVPGHTRFIASETGKSDRPDLQSASRVVAGGRALGSKENFDLVYTLADKLEAGVGASRAAVDAGYVLVIPLGGVIFYAAGRHPLAGIAAAFAGVSGGFSANFVPSSLDPLLQGLTLEGARLLDPAIQVNTLNNYFFTAASSVLIIGLGWYITDKIVEPRVSDIEIDGEERQVIMQVNKNGFFYVIDRITGELISAEPYVQTTWASHNRNGMTHITLQTDGFIVLIEMLAIMTTKTA